MERPEAPKEGAMALRNTVVGSVLAGTLVALAACGGGGGASTSVSEGTGEVSGVITGFGSVYVNGVRYQTDGATIRVEGQPADERALRVGMVVFLQGRKNGDGTGVADLVEFDDELEGVVTASGIGDDGTGTLAVMGQTVIVVADTLFESDVAGIDAPTQIVGGNVVEVSGFSDGAGTVFATRLEVKQAQHTPGDELELKGVVTDLDTSAFIFRVGDLVVDYSAALEVPGSLSDGLYVEVKGDQTPVGTPLTLAATRVELVRNGRFGLRGEEGEEVEIEGIVTSVEGLPASFQLNGQSVLLGALDDDDDEIDLDQIRLNARVEVEGRFGADGVLIAHEVELEDEGDTELEIASALEGVDADTGRITLMGQTVQVTGRTRLKDDRDNEHYFNIGDLRVGDFIEVCAIRVNGGLVARKLEREDDDIDTLEGVVESVSGDQIMIAGIEVAIGELEVPSVGDEVEVKGLWANGILTADTLQFH